MLNRYSLILAGIMGLLLWKGASMAYYQNLWCFIPLILGGLMFKGFKIATPSPKKVWLITFFGKKTSTVIRNWPVLVLDWIPLKPVGYIEFELLKRDHDFPMKKPIRCSDGGYIEGIISTSLVANDSGGQRLSDFDDIGRMDGVISQLDDILTSWVQEIANEHDSKWMETQGIQIIDMLLPRITGEQGTTSGSVNNQFDDTRGFGITVTKFQPLFRPPEKVIDARNKKRVEEAERDAEVYETQTINQQVELRYRFYKGKKTKKECREEIFDERVLEAGKYQKIVNVGGLNVANVGNQGTKT